MSASGISGPSLTAEMGGAVAWVGSHLAGLVVEMAVTRLPERIPEVVGWLERLRSVGPSELTEVLACRVRPAERDSNGVAAA